MFGDHWLRWVGLLLHMFRSLRKDYYDSFKEPNCPLGSDSEYIFDQSDVPTAYTTQYIDRFPDSDVTSHGKSS